MANRKPGLLNSVRLCAVLLSFSLTACLGGGGGDKEPVDEDGECGPLPHFTVLPVAEADILSLTVVGGLEAPGHTLPTDHVGVYLTGNSVPVLSPGAIRVSRVNRTTYLVSPFRQGKQDYSVFFRTCKDVEGWFGHLPAISKAIPNDPGTKHCKTYSTESETLESCSMEVKGIHLAPGDTIGFAGGETAGAMDFGLLDFRVQNFYATPSRFPPPLFHAVCPHAYFDSTNREILLSTVVDYARTGTQSGEPRCGTMEVDVAGTAKGVWAAPGPAIHESRFVVLANYPYHPETRLALSMGPHELGARTVGVPRQTSGRVNRAFEQIAGDGLIYCYTPVDVVWKNQFPTFHSWLVSLAANGTLTMERVEHAENESPCDGDPASWAFGGNAMTLTR